MNTRILIAATVSFTLAGTLACKPSENEESTSAAEEQAEPSSEISGEAHEGSEGADNEPAAQADNSHRMHDNEIPADIQPGETKHYGAPFSGDSETMSLAGALEACLDSGEACRVKADVSTTCQSMGCWFTITDEDVDSIVRVEMLDYGFNVPKNAHDAEAEFEGTLEQKTIPEAAARHYARESSGDEAAEAIEGPQKMFVWTISGVTLTRAEEG